MQVSIYSSNTDYKNIKKLQYNNSRTALKNALKRYNKNLINYKIINHNYIEQYPEYVVSLAHTDNIGVSFTTNKKVQSLGIDIESKSRSISNKISKWIINKQDIKEELLNMWVKKESAYKALWPLYHDKITFIYNDIIIRNNIFYLENFENNKGQIRLFKKMINNKEYLISAAYIK